MFLTIRHLVLNIKDLPYQIPAKENHKNYLYYYEYYCTDVRTPNGYM